MAEGPFQSCAEGLKVAVRLQPGASRAAIEGRQTLSDGRIVLKVRVTAQPEGGKANAALVKLLAKSCKVPKTAVEVVAGHSGRLKTVLIAGDPEVLKVRLAALGSAGSGPESR